MGMVCQLADLDRGSGREAAEAKERKTMLVDKKIEHNALARAAREEQKKQQAASAAATATRSWYITHIYGPGVKRTQEMLQHHGFESWYPMLLKGFPIPRNRLTRAQRRSTFSFMEMRRVPFMRNYLLVSVDLLNDHWHGPFRDAGAFGLACKGDVPYGIMPADLARLRSFETDGAIPGETKVQQLFAPGDAVRMCSGPFAGFTGTVDQVDEEGRLGLLIDIFGRPTLVTPEFSEFEKIARPPSQPPFGPPPEPR